MNAKPLCRFLVTCVLGMTLLAASCAGITSSAATRTTVEPSPTAPPTPIITTYQDLNQLIDSDPAQIDNSTFPITPVEALHVTSPAPEIDMATYSLSIAGLVNNPPTLDYDEILAYPSVTETVLLICQKSFADNAEWTGVPLKTLLSQAGVKPEASEIAVHSVDGFQISIPLKVAEGDGVLLAYRVNGQVLPKEHGFPVRWVVKGQYALYWVKWVDRIEVR